MANRARAAGIVIPLRSFVFGKARLASVLDATARVELARTMADRVVDAAAGRPILVVSSAPEVFAWATERGVEVCADPGLLDAAALAGRAWATDLRLTRYVVADADLPLVTSFDAVDRDDVHTAMIVPDRHDDGTPVLSLPTVSPFEFSYGPGSLRRHIVEAERRGLAVEVVHDLVLGFDVDTPSDLAALDASDHPTR